MSTYGKHFLMCSALLFLTGCASYEASSLSTLCQDSPIITTHQNSDVSTSWKVFDKKDCKTFLGRDVLSKGYVPVQMTIRNNSNDPMYISPDNFNIALMPSDQVAEKVHTSTAGRVAAWGVCGLILSPFLIPAIYDGIRSSNANRSLDADYQFKSLKEHLIQPRATWSSIIFIPKKELNQRIEMFLVNDRTQEKITFCVAK